MKPILISNMYYMDKIYAISDAVKIELQKKYNLESAVVIMLTNLY